MSEFLCFPEWAEAVRSDLCRRDMEWLFGDVDSWLDAFADDMSPEEAADAAILIAAGTD